MEGKTVGRSEYLAMNVTPLDELQWKSPEWIQVFGLRTENVLDYFSESPFFDKTSNNQIIKMQRQFSQLNDPNAGVNMTQNIMNLPDGKNVEDELAYVDPARRQILFKYPMYMQLEEELMKLDGTEYVLSSVREPDFWVIKKQKRINNTTAGSSRGPRIIPLQDYYIIGANVYQSPTVFKIVQSRLMSTSYHLNSTLKSLYDLIEFQPSQGVHYKVPIDTATTTATTGANNGNNVGGGSNKNSVRPTGAANMATVPSTTNVNMTVNTVGTGGQTVDNGAGRAGNGNMGITTEMLDKLMVTSIRSTPSYI